jgi:DNA helicase-2/ATP-dependent DNA helicase PcrA
MTTERFSKLDFEDALDKILSDTTYDYSCIGLRAHDYRYVVQISERVFMQISSSVDAGGFAADTADDSIRVWLADHLGMPLGNKTQKYVTRVAGWDERLGKVIADTLYMGAAIQYCNTCASVERVFVVKKEGPNKGRVFTKCDCANSFTWLDEPKAEEQPKSPACPKCGGMMMIRNRKSDGNKFWGCRMFPACNGTRGYDGDFQEKVEVATAPDAKQHTEMKTEGMTWSGYQVDIFRAVQNLADGDNLVVEARAGTGKTTTIAQSTKLLPHDKKTVVLVFNKHNVEPVKMKVPQHIMVRTYHSLAYAACRKAWGAEIKVDEKKVDYILENILDKQSTKHMWGTIRQIVSLVKANLTSTSDEDLNDIAGYYGIELNGDSVVIFQAVKEVVSRCAANTRVIDYDDMCWLPIFHNVPMDKFDYVYVDEAQDTNKVQMAIALNSVADAGHVIAVGDRFQSMYGFRGADAQAIPNLVLGLDAKVLPLSTTYRNPQCIVDLVAQKFPEIGLEGTGKAGTISNLSYEQALVEYAAGDMVLCRTNAPLVPPVFDLIRRGVKATIRGRDIGKGLLSLVKKMRADDITALLSKLSEYQNKEVSKLMAADKTAQAQSLGDKVETIIALADGIDTIFDLENRITSIFSDDVEGVVFSTIHKAKGLEAETVYILGPDLLPHPMAKKEWERVQEANIEYVALTRTLSKLVYVPRKDRK